MKAKTIGEFTERELFEMLDKINFKKKYGLELKLALAAPKMLKALKECVWDFEQGFNYGSVANQAKEAIEDAE